MKINLIFSEMVLNDFDTNVYEVEIIFLVDKKGKVNDHQNFIIL
jgi:hypothetical protein